MKERDDAKNELDELKRGGKRQGQRGREPRYFTPVGGLLMGLRANLCHTPATCLGFVLQTDVHKTTVCKWELVLDACLQQAVKNFYVARESELHMKGGFGLHNLRSDATNARIWHKRKLHAFEADSIYAISHGDGGGADGDDSDAASVSKVAIYESIHLGDLQVVADGSAKGCRSMIIKQCQSVGVPIWGDAVRGLEIPLAPGAHWPLHLLEELERQKLGRAPDSDLTSIFADNRCWTRSNWLL